MYRDHTKVIKIGNRVIGGGNPILIQSMTNTKTEDVEATVAQILSLEKAGCDIIRCAVPTMEAAKALINGKSMGTGTGHTKKAAEQAAISAEYIRHFVPTTRESTKLTTPRMIGFFRNA